MSYFDLAEDISHGIAGDNPNVFQKMASHGLGYLGAGFQKTVDVVTGDSLQKRNDKEVKKAINKIKVASPTTAHKQQPRLGTADKNMSKPSKKEIFKAKMAAKRAAKKEVKKEMKSLPPRRLLRNGRALRRRYNANFAVANVRRTRNVTAPVAYGRKGFTGNKISFGRGRRDGCLRMNSTMRIGYLQMSSTGSVDLFAGSTGHLVKGAWPLALPFAHYNDQVISNFVQNFESWNVTKFRFRYVNTVTTAQSGKLYFIYTSDPATVNDVYGVQDDTYLVDVEDFNSKADLWETPLYSPCASRWYYSKVRDDKDMCKTSGHSLPSTSNVVWTVDAPDLSRQIQGALLFAHRSITTPVSDFDIGDLFIDFQLECCDISLPPTASTFRTHNMERELDRLLEKRGIILRGEVKEEEKKLLAEDKMDEKKRLVDKSVSRSSSRSRDVKS